MEHLHALLSFSFIAPHKYPPWRRSRGRLRFCGMAAFRFLHLWILSLTLLLTEESVAHIAAYGWSGNVRELENCIQLHVNLAEGASIVIPPLASTPNTAGTSPRPTTSPPARESTASTAPQ